jgi:catechol 2,3-dioxygenase-like lactoylglutathione lyase family enzyme
MSSWAGNIWAVTVYVEDLDGAARFYREVFDLPMVHHDDNSTVFKLGGTLINLLKVEAAHELIEPAQVGSRDAGSRVLFTIKVDDVDAVCATLAERGVTLLNGPIDRPWGHRTAAFMDPAGNVWEIAA